MLNLKFVVIVTATLSLLLIAFVVHHNAVGEISDYKAGYSDTVPHLYGSANVYNMRYTGSAVETCNSVYIRNDGTVKHKHDASFTYRLRLKITDINDRNNDGEITLDELTPVLREFDPPPEGGGTVKIGESDRGCASMSLSTAGLIEGDDYGMIGYSRLMANSKVKDGFRYVKRSTEWLIEAYSTFTIGE